METAKTIALSMLEGIWDSVRNIFVIFYLDREMNKKVTSKSERNKNQSESSKKSSKDAAKSKNTNVGKRLIQCCGLNGGIFLLSIILFEYGLLPVLKQIVFYMGQYAVWNFIQTTLSWVFSFIWVIPLFVLSKIINTFWFQDIADAAYEYRLGRPTLIPSISKLLADVVFSLIVQTLFLFQSVSLGFIPYVGKFLCFLHICLLYSLYSFEYKWFNQGYELHRRLLFIEENWPYYIGFGFVLALLTQICESFVINGCLFSMFFPLFIISGNESSPQKRIDFPLRLFSLVVMLSNNLVSRKLKSSSATQKVAVKK